MAGFESSKIYGAAKVTYDAVQMFKSVASKIYDSAINSYTGNAIENKRAVRSAMRSVKEGLKSFKNYISNKTEDLIFDGKEKLGQLRDWGNDKKDTLHYYLLEGQKRGKDLLDTAHYNLLVAGDKVKPLKDLSLKSFKPLQTVGKAGLNGAALVGGMAMARTAKVTYDAVQMFKSVASKIYDSAINSYTGNAIENKRAVRSAMRSVKEGLKSFKNYISNKTEDLIFDGKEKLGQLRDWGNDKKDTLHYYLLEGQKRGKDLLDTAHYNLLVAGDKVKPLKDLSLKSFKPLQTVGKAGLNGAALVGGFAMAGTAKVYESGAKFVEGKYNSAKDTVNKVTSWGKEQTTEFKNQAKEAYGNSCKKVGGLFNSVSAKLKETKNKASNQTKGFFNKLGGKISTEMQIAKSKVKNSKVVTSAREFADKTNTAINTGMAMAGVAHAAAKKQWNSVKKVTNEKATEFINGANSRIMGGLNMANNVVNNIVNGGKETLTSVGQTLSSAKQGINQGITAAKQAIKEQARGNTASWYRLGQMQGRS